MYYVYRYMLDDRWIYVGKTDNSLMERLYAHRFEPKFKPYRNAVIQYIELGNRSDMNVTESMLIKLMKPVLNRNDLTENILPFKYDDSNVVWRDIKNAPRKTSQDKTISIDTSLLNDMLDKYMSNENNVVYGGSLYGTYKILFSDVYSYLAISRTVHPSTIKNKMNEMFKKCSIDRGRQVECCENTAEGVFFFYTYKL